MTPLAQVSHFFGKRKLSGAETLSTFAAIYDAWLMHDPIA